MAEYTQNYKLKKPLPNEFYDVADQNGNMDKIDSALKKHDDLLDKKVELDENGKICKEQLPDNILTTGEDGKLPDAQIPASITNHIANKQNPHAVTAAQVGAIPTAQKGAANGVATLDANRQLISSQIPVSITNHIANKQNPHGVTAAQVGACTEAQVLEIIKKNKQSTFQNLITGRLF